VPNEIDALLTLTALSLLAVKAVPQLVISTFSNQSFTNSPGTSLTWHDACTRGELEVDLCS
jgi:hypothetical protein